MSDRGVFLAAFLTLVLVVASAFALPELFFFELLKSTIFVVVAVMVFFGEDKFPYMLGILAPLLWFVSSLLSGDFVVDMATLARFLRGRPTAPLETPLHGFAMLSALALIIVSVRAWRKQITEKFFGKTFGIALAVGLIWVGLLATVEIHFLSAVRPH